MKRKHQTIEPDFVVVSNQPLSDVERRKLSGIIAQNKKSSVFGGLVREANKVSLKPKKPKTVAVTK